MGRNVYLGLLITSILLTISCSAQEECDTTDSSAEIDQMWNDFKLKYGKSYGSESEEQRRKEIFIENLNKIQAQNDLYATGQSSFTAGINQFHDLTESEFFATTTCFSTGALLPNPNATIYNDNATKLPKEIDWRPKGYVTKVKDQGQCRACWAFATTGTLEALTARKTGRLVPLSEQNLVDCSRKYVNNGCNDGAMGRTYHYISDNGGINSQESYPYEGTEGPCRYQPDKVAATCDSVGFNRGERNLQVAVANVGPVAVAISVCESLRTYAGGIFDDDTCTGNLSHAMLVVGYGTDPSTGKDYWTIKNSWGTTWGKDGYVLIVRNKQMCRLGHFSIYPILFKDQFRGSEEPDEDD